MKIITWNDGITKREIQRRFSSAAQARRYHENRWIRNEASIYSAGGSPTLDYSALGLGAEFDTGIDDVDSGGTESSTAYTLKNFRFIHAQMSANPPSVVMRPQSSDQGDHRKADAADKISRWAKRQYILQEKSDQLCLGTLLYGTGLMKTVWDSSRGAIMDYDEESGEIKLEGDIAISIPFIWNIYIDPDAKSVDEIRYIIERVYIDYEEACQRWPDKKDLLDAARMENGESGSRSRESSNSFLNNEHYNCVELLEYWEPGFPPNGHLGRYAITTISGDVIEPCRPNPFRFRKAGAVAAIEDDDKLSDAEKLVKIQKLPEQAQLPYHILSDIDIPNTVYGASMVEYAAQLQSNLNAIDSTYLDNIRSHGSARIVVPETAGLADDSITDSPIDIIKISGNQPPYYMQPAQLMPDMTAVRQNHVQGINDVMGVNESMFGQQSREQAAAAMQYATNQGNMIRHRLFNKYVMSVESIYRAILNLIRKHWTVGRTIHVLGKEKALEALDLKGADIDGGYDIVGEYGVSLSLDPITRRQEVLTMQPLFEKAGIPARASLRMMKLSELESMYDKLDQAENRQKEIFDRMIATGTYIEPKRFRDHANMIAWAYDYFMSSEFESLPEEIQILCEAHIEARAVLAAQDLQPAGAPPAGAPPAGVTDPAAAGMAPVGVDPALPPGEIPPQ